MSQTVAASNDGPAGIGFREHSEAARVQQIPLSHLSVEVGHFYMEELESGEEPIRAQFERVRPWLEVAEKTAVSGGERPRVSTCFLIDDYFSRHDDVSVIMEKILRLSREAGVRIDYVARESSCAMNRDRVSPAALVAGRLLPEPAPETTGSRPPVQESGWLANGSPARDGARVLGAMRTRGEWEPPVEFGRRNHSVFLDIELWRDLNARSRGGDFEEVANRQWSCAFLASVWQLIRLGLLRDHGRPAMEVTPWNADDNWPAGWHDFPDVIRLNPNAKPFCAYRTCSLVPQNFLPIENAVREVLNHVLLERAVLDAVSTRAAEKGIHLPESIADRVSHVFLESVL